MLPVLIITGPTAVGKTGLSLELASSFDLEIVSADSRKIYAELTIGTAKPSREVLDRITHHFINERSVFEQPAFSAGAFAEEAYRRIRAVRRRGRIPIVVGGSTLYIHALQFGLADIPDVPRTVRLALEERLEAEGAERLYAELQEVDPKAASRMDATKTQRLVRALEVYHHTGRPISYYYDNKPEPPFAFKTVVLRRERAELYRRINRRSEKQLERGLLDEVRELLDRGVDTDYGPMRTIGYRETTRHLRGEIGYDEMVRLLKRDTRRYAKRQLTWFRRYDEYTWVEADESAARVAELLRALQKE